MLFSAMLRKFEILCNAIPSERWTIVEIIQKYPMELNQIQIKKHRSNQIQLKKINRDKKNTLKSCCFYFGHLTIAAKEKS